MNNKANTSKSIWIYSCFLVSFKYIESGDSMLEKAKIDRINALANKKKSEGLTESEAKEQTKLRAEYLQAFRGNFKSTIENTKVIDPEGNDVTPDKVKEIQKDRNIRK